MISLNGLFRPMKLSTNVFVLESTWAAPSHLRPLTLFFIPFLQSKPHHVEKYLTLYADFYRSQQPRPLNVYLQMPTLADFAFHFKTAATARSHITNLHRHLDPADKVIMHGMSIGCFLQAATLNIDHQDIMPRNPLNVKIKDRVVGQFFDSPVYGGPARFGLDRMVLGMTEGLKNPLLKKMTQSTVKGYLGMSSTRLMMFDHFLDTFINGTSTVPTLALTSEEDPLCDVSLYENGVINVWKSRALARNVSVNYQCFPGNAHARILHLYPEQYKKLFHDYLNQVQILLEVFDDYNQLQDGDVGSEMEAKS